MFKGNDRCLTLACPLLLDNLFVKIMRPLLAFRFFFMCNAS